MKKGGGQKEDRTTSLQACFCLAGRFHRPAPQRTWGVAGTWRFSFFWGVPAPGGPQPPPQEYYHALGISGAKPHGAAAPE